MRSLLTNQFEVCRILEETPTKITFVGKHSRNRESDVVVKIFRKASFSSDGEALAQFFSWHRGVQHPCLARILDAGLTDRRDLYYVREYLEEPKFDYGAEGWISQLLSAVRILHLGGRIHGAISLQQIFSSNGLIKLADPLILGMKNLPVKQAIIPYVAPEVLAGSDTSAASDMYSLGAVLYRVLSGAHPFDDFDPHNLRAKYIWASCKPLNSVCHVSDSLSRLVGSLLDKDPTVRPTIDAVKRFFSVDVLATRGPFVGRDEEFQRIRTFLMKPRTGLKVVLIEGEPGIGKTRFISELEGVAGLTGEDFVIGTCRAKALVPCGPVWDGMNLLLRRRAPRAEAVKTQLGNFSATLMPYLEMEGNDESRPGSVDPRVISDLVSFLRRLAEAQPITVVLEDIDFADESTLNVLEQFCLRAADLPLNVILSRRSSREPMEMAAIFSQTLRENFLVCHLKSIDTASAKTVASYLALTTQHDEICRASGGNPLFIEEHARHGIKPPKLSTRLERTLFSIITSLSKSSIQLLQALAIFEIKVARDMLQRFVTLTDSEFESAECSVVFIGLITSHDGYLFFKNSSFRNHIYSHTPRAKRTRLHKRAYGFLKGSADEHCLSHHAFHGHLYNEAAALCVSVATNLCNAGHFSAALDFYKHAVTCLRRLGLQLSPLAKSDLALCYARTGKPKLAKKIYRTLLPVGETSPTDRAFVASIYYRLADPAVEPSVAKMVQLSRRAIQYAPAGFVELARYYAKLGQSLINCGEVRLADEAMVCAEQELAKHSTDWLVTFVRSIRGSVLSHNGKSREAMAIIDTCRSKQPLMLATQLTNVALCWEHLGHLNRARETQLQAKSLADTLDNPIMRVVSLLNLGAFETKLGNLNAALRLFMAGSDLIAEFQKRDRHFNPSILSMVHADRARLHLELGEYDKTIENLNLVAAREILGMEGVQFRLTQCQLHLCCADFYIAKKILKSLDQSEIAQSEYICVERKLIQSWFDDIDSETRLARCLEGHAMSVKLGTLYQRSALANRLSAILIACGRLPEARERAREASVLARRHGYKVVAAKALLYLALSSEDDREREAGLLKTFHTGSEMGLQELTAEAAFHVATLYHSKEQFVTAEDYLTKSLSITKELAEGVPPRSKVAYLSYGWRSKANELAEDFRKRKLCAVLSSPFSFARREDQPFFRSVYRFTLASGRVKTREEFVSVLLQTMESTRRSVILVARENQKTAYYPATVKVSDELSNRIQVLNSKAGNNVYFGNPGKIDPKAPLAWIPLRSRLLQGGIYIVYRQGESPLSEEEMEFLTVIATVANAMLVQFDNRPEQSQADLTRFHEMVGASKAIREVYSQIEVAAGNTANVLIEGESGTGKELVARAIHQAGPRSKEAFIAVDCGALPESLIEAELFGAKKGSYTGAVADRPGLFEAAHRGTIFLDEISNTTTALQAKLLRVIQQREVRRIGETRDRPVDVRLIVASNANLEALAEDGRFRKDLLYRLKVLHIKVPPLRARRDDIPMLAHSFLEKLNAGNNTKKYFGAGVINRLSTHLFPGNVRELQNAIERSFFSARGMMITDVPLDGRTETATSQDEIQSWFKDLSEGRKDFWTAVHNRYKRRDISREKVLALVDFGLRSTHGNYKMIASAFRLKEKEYRRFMDFLRRNDCLLDFRPYRKSQESL